MNTNHQKTLVEFLYLLQEAIEDGWLRFELEDNKVKVYLFGDLVVEKEEN